MQYRQIYKQNKTLMYKIERKKIKNINVKVLNNNEVLVTCPPHISLEQIDSFVLKHFEKLYKFIDNRKQFTLFDINENFIYIKGIKHELIFKYSHSRSKYEIIGNKIYLFIKDESQKEKIINKMLTNIGQNYIINMAVKLAKKHNFNVSGGFSTKWYKSKWGQCEPMLSKITLAIQLIMFNDEIIEYVIVHELCHLIYADHSNEFWDLVAQYYPNYKWAREKLKFQV